MTVPSNRSGRAAIHPVVWLLPAVALLVALAPMPYGYYMLLRLVVTAAAGYLAYQEWVAARTISPWLVALVVLMLLFNPIIPVHLTRGAWAPIDIAASITFFVHWRRSQTVR